MAGNRGTVFDFESETLDGAKRSLSEFSDRVLLIVNTASQCGFTPQYAGLESLYRTYKDRGLVVLGFPCNQFGGQEPGDAGEIGAFCERNYGVSFPMFAKIDVNECTPAVSIFEEQKTGTSWAAGRRGHSVELHQVSREPERPGCGAVRTGDET
jgi:glutathione peroxidase-family protein